MDEVRILIACDKFKGSLDAPGVAAAIAGSLPDHWRKISCPIADGGEGFVDAMLAGTDGVRVIAETTDALGRKCEAVYGLSGNDAFIEMSAASGLWRIAAEERNPLKSSTFGTGLLIRHAAEISKAGRIFIGIGGSATNDGGVGMARALGVRFLDAEGEMLEPIPEALVKLAAIDEPVGVPLPDIVVACDVDHPLCGERGASVVFGPQKGASQEDVVFLDRVLGLLAKISGGEQAAQVAGAGAAGGLGFGLMRFAGARLVSGFDLVAEALELQAKIREADLVITGEGSLDAQTLGGKGPAGVAAMAKEAGVPVIAIAGRAEDQAKTLFDSVLSLETFGLPKEESIARAAELIGKIVSENASMLDLVVKSRNGGKSR